MDPAVASVVSSGVQASGNVANGLFGLLQQNMANKANAQLAERQNAWNIAQWNRENAYNTPLAQVQRMREAGLNPDLYYGQNGMMNEAAQSPTMERATMYPYQPNFDLSGAVNAYWNSQIAQAQVKNMEADAALKEQKVKESGQWVLESQQRNRESLQRMAESVQRCNEMAAHIRNLEADERLKIRQAYHIKFNETLETKKFNLMEKDVFSQMKLRTKQGKLYDAQRVFTFQQFREAQMLLPLKLAGMQQDITNKKTEQLLMGLEYNLKLELGALDIKRSQMQTIREQNDFTLDFGNEGWKFLYVLRKTFGDFMNVASPFIPSTSSKHVDINYNKSK